jgi:hypothetical protein
MGYVDCPGERSFDTAPCYQQVCQPRACVWAVMERRIESASTLRFVAGVDCASRLLDRPLFAGDGH